jgi:hypothetical protein
MFPCPTWPLARPSGGWQPGVCGFIAGLLAAPSGQPSHIPSGRRPEGPAFFQAIRPLATVHWGGTGVYSDLQYYSRWAQIDKRADWCVYLSQNFWFAKNYAINTGGETVQQALQAAHKFLAFVTDHAARQRHLKRLERQRVKQPSLVLLEQQVHNLQHPYVLDRLQHQVCQLQNKWHALTEGGYPVVYAKIVEQEWFPQCPEPCWNPSDDGSSRMPEATNLECQQSISPERIVAKAQYVNGTQRGYHGPSPSRWEVARKPRTF